ncbi:MAG TPA: hypothetical protein VEF72_22610 [Mycobacterium sp.]|nr:hypothetical protein [Mycobacterium sp.]
MAERWIEAGYCVLLIDPEGDHVQLRQLNQVQVVDGGHDLPEPTELVNTLLHPRSRPGLPDSRWLSPPVPL